MKFIKNNVEEYIQEPGIDGMYKACRDAAAICYQTDTNKMKLGPREFVEKVLIKNGHGRPLEFGTVYLKVENDLKTSYKYEENKYSKVNVVYDDDKKSIIAFITTNLRVIMQGYYKDDEEAFMNNYDENWLEDIEKYWCEPTEYHEIRRTFTILTCRGCSDDMRTHITLSSICESSRYCNYSNDKFGGEMTFIWPYWIDESKMDDFNNKKGELYTDFHNMLVRGCSYDAKKEEATTMVILAKEEEFYMMMVSPEYLHLQPQQGKRVFPLGAKVELKLCGFDDSWQNFFWRRCDQHADPECIIVANKIKELYNEKD